MKTYPELDKLAESDFNTLVEFMEHLRNKFTLAKYGDSGSHLKVATVYTERFVADYLGLDYDKIQAERNELERSLSNS
jgi:hypothetical protein